MNEKITDILDKSVKAMADRRGKYLIFVLADEEYGIEVTKIREIICMMPITTVPKMPEFIKGVLNLRGKVIPVIDLRLKLGMNAVDYTERTCIIVVEIADKGGDVSIGVVVDSVLEVLNISAEDIEDPPDLGTSLDAACVLGIAKMESGVKILINIDLVVGIQEIGFTG